jgi:hypothetical protein
VDVAEAAFEWVARVDRGPAGVGVHQIDSLYRRLHSACAREAQHRDLAHRQLASRLYRFPRLRHRIVEKRAAGEIQGLGARDIGLDRRPLGEGCSGARRPTSRWR